MMLKEYIENKIKELENEGYKKVQFNIALNVILRRNGIEEDFLAAETDLNNECYEYEFFKIDENEEILGSEINMHMVPKGKRKQVSKRYYVGLVV